MRVLFFLILALPCFAQSIGIGYVYNSQSVNSPDRVPTNGIRAVGDAPIWKGLHLSGFVDRVGGKVLSEDTRWTSWGFGPKIIPRPEGQWSPILIGTIGRSRVSIGKLVSENSMYVEGGGGIRWRLHRHWHWEINALYTQTRHFELTQRSAKIVTGISFQF